MSADQLDDWIKDLAYFTLDAVARRDLCLIEQRKTRVRGSWQLLIDQFKLYPAEFGAQPAIARDRATGIEYLDDSGWFVMIPFYDVAGNETDLELQLSIRGVSDEFDIEIEDMLVP